MKSHPKRPRDPNQLANMEAADRWLEENDPEGVAFEYPVIVR
jgi:hypothetical protein